MKKFFSILLVLALAVTMFAGCGESGEKSDTRTDSASESGADANTDQDGGESGMKPIVKEDLKIGVIHITDPAEGSGYTYTHDLGV